MAAKPEKLTFRVDKDPQYRIVAVNGVWGGPTIRGDIRVDFFYERQASPESVTQAITAAGQLGETIERDPDPTIYTRTLMVSMMLTPIQADSIGKFLQEKAAMVEKVEAAERERKKDTPSDDGTGTTH
jgi:hypothetical protein